MRVGERWAERERPPRGPPPKLPARTLRAAPTTLGPHLSSGIFNSSSEGPCVAHPAPLPSAPLTAGSWPWGPCHSGRWAGLWDGAQFRCRWSSLLYRGRWGGETDQVSRVPGRPLRRDVGQWPEAVHPPGSSARGRCGESSELLLPGLQLPAWCKVPWCRRAGLGAHCPPCRRRRGEHSDEPLLRRPGRLHPHLVLLTAFSVPVLLWE